MHDCCQWTLPETGKNIKEKLALSSITSIGISLPWVCIKSIHLSNSASDVRGFIESIHFVDLLG